MVGQSLTGLGAEVGVDDSRVRTDHRWFSVGEQFTVVEDNQAGTQGHDELDFMVGDEKRLAMFPKSVDMGA